MQVYKTIREKATERSIINYVTLQLSTYKTINVYTSRIGLKPIYKICTGKTKSVYVTYRLV